MSDELMTSDKVAGQFYYNLRRPSNIFTSSFPIEEYYPLITQEMVDRGYFIRYFVRQSNHTSGDIMEVDEKTAKHLSTNPLYQVITIEWKITGKIDDIMGPPHINSPVRLYTGVQTANKLAVQVASRDMPGLELKLMNYLQFWREVEDEL